MNGLLGTLNLGARALQTYQQGLEVTGHNLSQVNNPAYARQRLASISSAQNSGQSAITSLDDVTVVQIRSALLDNQITAETSVGGALLAEQTALQNAQTHLEAEIDRRSTVNETSDATSSNSSQGLAGSLNAFFAGFQGLANDPASLAQRDVLLAKASDLAGAFNRINRGLQGLQSDLNQQIQSEADQANSLLADLAKINGHIMDAQSDPDNAPNDLIDLRQQKIEQLAQLVKIDLGPNSDGSIDISVNGVALVTGSSLTEKLEPYDAGNGQWFIRSEKGQQPLSLSSGRIGGAIEARDGAIAQLRSDINKLASTLIQNVNQLHQTGYNLNGQTGLSFFTGTDASDIKVNETLAKNPALLQASAQPASSGNNQVALALAQLNAQPQAALNNQTFTQSYAHTVTVFGQALQSVNTDLDDHKTVEAMLSRQRESVSGVSLDEELTDLTKYQKAFAASAKLIALVDELLDSVLNMKR